MRSRKVEKLSLTIGKILAARGWEAKLKEYRIFGVWEKVVGQTIARHARPESLRGKKLTVIVDSSAWMQQLTLLKPEIAFKVNTALADEAVQAITLKFGELEALERPNIERALPAADLSSEERARVESYIAAIADPELRESLRGVIKKDLLSKKGAGKRGA